MTGNASFELMIASLNFKDGTIYQVWELDDYYYYSISFIVEDIWNILFSIKRQCVFVLK